MEFEQKILFYLDDSGQIVNQKNLENIFVYGGYFFLSYNERNKYKSKFSKLETDIKISKKINDEFKACNSKMKIKKKMFSIMNSENRILVLTKSEWINRVDLEDKASRGRFKDFMIKRLIRLTIEKLIEEGKISNYKNTQIIVNLDNQSTKSNGNYSVDKLIYGDLLGSINQMWNVPLFYSGLEVKVQYLDSKNSILIRAADFCANLSHHMIKNNLEFESYYYLSIKCPKNSV